MAKVDLNQRVEQTFDDFSKNLDLVRKFGVAAVMDALNAKLKGEGQTVQLSKDNVLSIMNQAIATSGLNQEIDHNLDKFGLDEVNKMLKLEHTPRYDTRPEVQNKNEMGVEVPQATRNFAPNPLLAKLDDAADPKARDRILDDMAQQIANNPNSPGEWTPMLNNVIDAHAKQRAAEKLRLVMAPAPRPTHKPRPDGMS
jgi:hypothetical protein